MGLFGDLDLKQASADPFALEDGWKRVTLAKMGVAHSDAKNIDGLTFSYTIEEGVDAGKKKDDWQTIPKPADPKNPSAEDLQKMGYIKQRLLALGVPENRLNDVEPDDVVGWEGWIKLQTNSRGYQNIVDMRKDAPKGAAISSASEGITFS